MKFGPIALEQAEGALLAHSTKLPGRVLKKGHIISAEDIGLLIAAGHSSVIAAILDSNDVPEDAAAERISAALAGAHTHIGIAFTGRCNLIADAHGLLQFDPARLDELNLIDETITAATLPAYEVVLPGQLIATIKIIPFAALEETVARAETLAKSDGPMISIAPFGTKRLGLIMTRLPGMKESILDKTLETAAARVEAYGSRITEDVRCDHQQVDVERALARLDGKCDIILLFGASAVVDRNDVLPAAVVSAGGSVDHFGMPVDPGNLLFTGSLGGHPLVGMPGCARSPKLNGFDWILWRLLADIPVTSRDIMLIGAGGLLKEISERGQLRQSQNTGENFTGTKEPEIAALVLAAGSSKRMGKDNKLLADINGTPLIYQTVAALQASNVTSVTVVTGHEADDVTAALTDLAGLSFVHNPNHNDGLSTSLKAGLAAIPETSDGFIICLGDMPLVTLDMLNELIRAFDPLEGRSICVPVYGRKRGNPILWGRAFLGAMLGLTGDTGARALLEEHADQVHEVMMANDGVLFDVDTPEQLQRLKVRVP